MVTNRAARRSLGAAVGVLADPALGEPPIQPQPVAAFGSTMTQLEERTYDDSRAAQTHLHHRRTSLKIILAVAAEQRGPPRRARQVDRFDLQPMLLE